MSILSRMGAVRITPRLPIEVRRPMLPAYKPLADRLRTVNNILFQLSVMNPRTVRGWSRSLARDWMETNFGVVGALEFSLAETAQFEQFIPDRGLAAMLLDDSDCVMDAVVHPENSAAGPLYAHGRYWRIQSSMPGYVTVGDFCSWKPELGIAATELIVQDGTQIKFCDPVHKVWATSDAWPLTANAVGSHNNIISLSHFVAGV